jgi:Astacin (Peptidase family M12A)
MMHEHQREDRDDYVIFHPERVGSDADQYEKQETESRTATYDFQSLMHYNVGDVGNPIFESRTGVPPPADIGGDGTLTITDKTFLESLYPAAPVIRRTDGEGGAGAVRQTSAIAVPSVNNTAVLANAIQNGSGNYQLVLWRIRENGVVLRMGDPADATGGEASGVHFASVGPLYVSAVANADGELLLISHSDSFARLKDSAGQAGEVRALHLLPLSDTRLLTPCVSASGRLLNIVWEVQPDGSFVRLFDSGTGGPEAKSVASALFKSAGSTHLAAILYADESSRLVLSTWRIDGGSIALIADSGHAMGEADLAQVVTAPTGHLVVVCRDGNSDLLLIPVEVADDGASFDRVPGEGRAGEIREVTALARPYGVLTAVISEAGHVLLIKWAMNADGVFTRLGESGTQAGEGSALSAAVLPFVEQATICTAVRDGSGNLLPITWDDADGPGELSVV